MIGEPRCSQRNCRHFIGVAQVGGLGEEHQVVACAAYPEGIPSEIAYGPVLHLDPYPGDRGIQYELDEEAS